MRTRPISDRLIRAAWAPNRPIAEMMVGLLADGGIEARVGVSSGGLGAYAPLAAPCEILVAEDRAEPAAALIASHFAARDPS